MPSRACSPPCRAETFAATWTRRTRSSTHAEHARRSRRGRRRRAVAVFHTYLYHHRRTIDAHPVSSQLSSSAAPAETSNLDSRPIRASSPRAPILVDVAPHRPRAHRALDTARSRRRRRRRRPRRRRRRPRRPRGSGRSCPRAVLRRRPRARSRAGSRSTAASPGPGMRCRVVVVVLGVEADDPGDGFGD